MAGRLTLLSSSFLEQYAASCAIDWHAVVGGLKHRSSYSTEDFEYYIIASSVFSTKIEGNSLDLNSFMNNRHHKTTARRKEFREIENMVAAYDFAAGAKLTLPNLLQAHKLLSQTILKASERGKYRKTPIGVFDNSSGRPVYVAVEPEFVKPEMIKLFDDVSILLKRKLSYRDTFYYASLIHLWMAMIHPFADGNGRIARLVEKWFLATKLGAGVWSIKSEKYYWDNRPRYYKNISLGYNYYSLKWERCIPFLTMLPEAFNTGI